MQDEQCSMRLMIQEENRRLRDEAELQRAANVVLKAQVRDLALHRDADQPKACAASAELQEEGGMQIFSRG